MTSYTDVFESGKRQILVADDEFINREILENVLADEYDVLKAEDGEMAYEMIKQNRNTLSLILLDLIMPKLTGLELLARLGEDPELKGIPVIVLTSDQDSEVTSLKKGAYDFIPKPYLSLTSLRHVYHVRSSSQKTVRSSVPQKETN